MPRDRKERGSHSQGGRQSPSEKVTLMLTVYGQKGHRAKSQGNFQKEETGKTKALSGKCQGAMEASMATAGRDRRAKSHTSSESAGLFQGQESHWRASSRSDIIYCPTAARFNCKL